MGKIEKALGLSLVLGAVLGSDAWAAADSVKQLEKADKLLTAGKPQAAIDILHEVVRVDPDNASAHMQLGAALAKTITDDKYDTAIKEEELALKLDPKSFGARIILGQIYANLSKYPDSIKILKEACELKPSSYGAHRDLGIAYQYAGKIDDAIATFRKAVDLKPEKPDAHFKLAVLLSKRGNTRDALNEANEAVRLAPGNDEAQIALGNIYLESRGDEVQAIEPFRRALGISRDNPFALSGLGMALAAQGKVDEGIENQKKALRVFPAYLPAYLRLAELLGKQSKDKEAEAVYQGALKLSPDDADARTAYAKFLEKTGRKDDARTELKKVLEKSPHFAPATEALAGLDGSKTK